MAKKPTTSDSHTPNLVKIEELSEKFESDSLKNYSIELEKKCLALGQSLDKALQVIEDKQREIDHLHEMMKPAVHIIGESSISYATEEEEIIEVQIRKIKTRARDNELSLDDTRKLDLLLKNKKQLQESKENDKDKTPKLPNNVKELLKLANSKDVTPKE
jgi:hypothetical protein